MSKSKKSTDSEFHLEHFVPYQLSVLSNTIARALAGAYQERFGISITEWRIIAVLRRYPGLSAAEVSERTALDGPAISRGVSGLARAGILRRREAPTDRRKLVLTLTAKGCRIFEQLEPFILEYQQQLLSALTVQQREVLQTVLPVLLRRAKELDELDLTSGETANAKMQSAK